MNIWEKFDFLLAKSTHFNKVIRDKYQWDTENGELAAAKRLLLHSTDLLEEAGETIKFLQTLRGLSDKQLWDKAIEKYKEDLLKE